MSEIAHAERAHAKLGASGSSRWIPCPGSVQLEGMFPDTTTDFAEEGTAAHELSELHLSHHLGQISKRKLNSQLKKFQENSTYYSQEMEDHIQTYVDIVMERVNAARARTSDAVVLIEHRLDFSEWVPEGFGTGDVVIISEGTVEVIDLKYGKGVPVSAINNSQMRLYGLGALNEFDMLYGVDKIHMTIVQPRLDNVSTEEMPATRLLEWAEEIIRPAATMAADGSMKFEAGDHCKFCKARSNCRTRAEANLEMMKFEFQDPPLLSVEEIGDILGKADALVKWAGDIKSYALDQAEKHGVKFPGWKLVEGRSNRIITDKEAAKVVLIDAKYDEDTILTPRELLAMGALEKAIGKKNFNDLLSDLIIKPAGKATLAPESDKRPELNSLASTVADFANTEFESDLDG